jgi:hypothetical protein
MRDLDGESQFLGILKMLVETILQDNRQLRDEMADDRLRAREQREKLVDQLLRHLPAILTQILSPSGTSPVNSPPSARAAAPDATPPSQEPSPSTAQTIPLTSVETPAADLPVRHWFYPSSAIGCGLNIDDLTADKLTCLRHEVTCSGCLAQLRADQENNLTAAKTETAAKIEDSPQDPSLSTPKPPRKIEGLSEEQRRALAQFQGACRVIGAHDDCGGWQLLGCAIEAELAALDLGVRHVPLGAPTTDSRTWHRAELEKYLARSDAGRGAMGIEGALHALLAAATTRQPRPEEVLTWIALFDNEVDRSVTWHTTRVPLQLDGISNVTWPETLLTLCGRSVPRRRILRTSQLTPAFTNQDRPCRNCSPGEDVCFPTSRSIASDPTRDGRGVRIDLTALIDECAHVILKRPRDGSPPMVALSADVVRSVAYYAQRLSDGIARAQAPTDAIRWREFATEGPAVGGDGAADAWGSGVHPIHVSTVWSNGSVAHALREALDKWQALAEGMRSQNFQQPGVQKLRQDLERIELLRQLINVENL